MRIYLNFAEQKLSTSCIISKTVIHQELGSNPSQIRFLRGITISESFNIIVIHRDVNRNVSYLLYLFFLRIWTSDTAIQFSSKVQRAKRHSVESTRRSRLPSALSYSPLQSKLRAEVWSGMIASIFSIHFGWLRNWLWALARSGFWYLWLPIFLRYRCFSGAKLQGRLFRVYRYISFTSQICQDCPGCTDR